jgi:hypothetical protein
VNNNNNSTGGKLKNRGRASSFITTRYFVMPVPLLFLLVVKSV